MDPATTSESALVARLERATARTMQRIDAPLDAARLQTLRHWLDEAADRQILILSASAATWLAEAHAAPLPDQLDDWVRVTRLALDLTQVAPGRCLMLDADELRRGSTRALTALAPQLGLRRGDEADPVADTAEADARLAPDAEGPGLGRWLAQAVVAAHPRAAALDAERLASCLPMTAGVDAAQPPRIDAMAALAAWHDKQHRTAALGRRLTAAVAQYEALQSERAAIEQRLASTQQQLTSITAQAHSVQQGWQREQHRLLEKLNAQERAREIAESELYQAQDTLSQRAFALQSAADLLRHADEQRDDLQAQLESIQQRLTATADQASADQQGWQREQHRLLEQLSAQQRAREAAESALYQALETAATAQSQSELAQRLARQVPTAGGDLACFSVAIVGGRDEPPHRELRFEFRQIRTPRGQEDSLEARLVNHLGHPGLVLLAGPARGPVTGLWQADGEEGGVPYMIVLPGDASHQARLNRMGHSDWRFLLALAGRMRARVEADDARSTTWAPVARRLQQLLLALPARLRYDALAVAAAEAPGALAVTFRPWSHGSDGGPQLELALNPRATATGPALLSLRWNPDGQHPPPFVRWPQDEQGAWLTQQDLPVGPTWSAEQRRAWWSQAPQADQGLALALLDALPAAAEAADVPEAERAALRRTARSLLREAHHDLRGLRWRRLARRWVGKA